MTRVRDQAKQPRSSRSSRGCKTCRIRRVKCDETWPLCQRCTSTGRSCDGSAKPPSQQAWDVQTMSSVSSDLSSNNSARSLSPLEREDPSLAFFHAYTLDHLEGLLGQGWKPLVQRAVCENEALQHAALALGRLHKTVASRSHIKIGDNDDVVVTKAYNKSLRKLGTADAHTYEDTLGVMLVACLMYTMLENMRRNHGMMLKHAINGLRIMQQNLNAIRHDQPVSLIPTTKLLPAFARLDFQVREITAGPPFLLSTLEAEVPGYFEYDAMRPARMPCFDNLDQAFKMLHQRWHALMAWVGDAVTANAGNLEIDELDERCRDLQDQFANMKTGLHLWKRSAKIETSRRTPAICALFECHFILAQHVLSDTRREEGKMALDRWTNDFDQLVDLCADVIACESSSQLAHTSSPAGKPVYIAQRFSPSPASTGGAPEPDYLTFDLGILPVLVSVGRSCRDAHVRHRALKLLEDNPRLEGLWDGLLCAQMGRALDEVERGTGESLDRAAERRALAAEIQAERRIDEIRLRSFGEEEDGRALWMEMYRRDRTVVGGWKMTKKLLRW